MLRIPVLPALLCSAILLAPSLPGQSGVLPAGCSDAATSRGLDAPNSLANLPEGLSATEWSSIRAAYEAHRHAAFAMEDGYQARNPGQQWLTRFDGRGFSTEPDAGGWTWGLQLERYGFEGHERAVSGKAPASAAGPRVAYDWDDTLQEWYVNDARGLEHGYTIRQRPPQDGESESGPLTFTLAVRGELRPEVQADGRGVRFVNGDGVAVLTYSGLSVFDADGQALSARLQPLVEGLLFSIDERGAHYPLTIDPIAQQAYLKASNTGASDSFGSSVSVSGNTVVVGAWGENSNATGVNGDQSNNSATEAGAAYVFVRSGSTWSQQAYLKASNTEGGDQFGRVVSVSGDTLVVGAFREGSNATGVNGNQSNNTVPQAGAAYLFVRNGTSWSQQAYLKASNTQASDFFGRSVSVSGDTVVVGAYGEDSNATGVNGDQNNNGVSFAGAAYVFVRSGTSWSQQAYLKAFSTGSFDLFGFSVSVSGDTVVVGADGEDDTAPDSGAAYVFVRSGSSWSQQAVLKASNAGAGDDFGFSVLVSGDTLVVGAGHEDSITTGVNGNQSNNSAIDAGAAYIFVRSGTNWSQQAYLKASNTQASDFFGSSVSVSGDTVVVGAYGEDSLATGLNGNQGNNAATDAGAAYVFVRSGTSWSQQAYLKASNTGTSDGFGFSVAVSADTGVVGAYQEASNATGVNGDQSNNSAALAGAAYVFDLDLDAWTDVGFGLAGVSGVPLLVGTGTLVAGSPGSLILSNAKPSAACILYVSVMSMPVPFKGGILVAFPWLLDIPLVTLSNGTLPLPFSWPAGVPPGSMLWFQYAIADLAAINKVSLSNALKATTP